MISSVDFVSVPAARSGKAKAVSEIPGAVVKKAAGTPDTDVYEPTAAVADKLKHMSGSTKFRFSGTILSLVPNMQDAWAEISAQMDGAIGKFMDGSLSGGELSAEFQRLSHGLYEASVQAGYPDAAPRPDQEPGCTEAFYGEFRRRILSIALQRNNEQGRQYVTGELNQKRTYKYYNADFYYKSEDAIAAVTQGMKELARDHGWDGRITDYLGKGLNLYANFNTVFSDSTRLERYCLDPKAVPPPGFAWFYETGGSPEPAAALACVRQTNPDGSETVLYQKRRTKFDPLDLFTARTWVTCTGKDGVRHPAYRHIIFHDQKSDRMNLGSLLSFDTGEESDAVNAFLKKMQLYPMDYFAPGNRCTGFQCRV